MDCKETDRETGIFRAGEFTTTRYGEGPCPEEYKDKINWINTEDCSYTVFASTTKTKKDRVVKLPTKFVEFITQLRLSTSELFPLSQRTLQRNLMKTPLKTVTNLRKSYSQDVANSNDWNRLESVARAQAHHPQILLENYVRGDTQISVEIIKKLGLYD